MHLKSLPEQMRISEIEIQERKRLLGLTPELLALLAGCRHTILPQLDTIIEAFYAGQLEIPEIRKSIRDAETLSRLKGAMRGYIAALFSGDYGERYVNSRLRIRVIHARIGVKPMLYVASVHQLEYLLMERLAAVGTSPQVAVALAKILLFDLVLVFDTYIQGLVDEVTAAKDEVAADARSLERTVAERTAALKRLAQTDDLTGLKNRRAMIAALADEILRIRSRRGSFAVAFLDVDKFKQVNDTAGHLAGDRVLQNVARAFQAGVPDPEHVFRYGGDEFVAIFPMPHAASAAEAAARIKAQIEAQLEERVTVSVGCTYVAHNDVPPLEEILTSIDREMYRHKAAATGPEPNGPHLKVGGSFG